MWWKKSPCPDNDVTGEAENFSDYPRISVNKNNISCLLGGCNCPFLLAKCLSCWHRCWILFPLFNKRGNNYTAEWKDKGRSNSFLSKVQIGYESFIWVQLLTRVPTSHLNETTQYKYSMQELFSFRYIFSLSTFFYNFVHMV